MDQTEQTRNSWAPSMMDRSTNTYPSVNSNSVGTVQNENSVNGSGGGSNAVRELTQTPPHNELISSDIVIQGQYYQGQASPVLNISPVVMNNYIPPTTDTSQLAPDASTESASDMSTDLNTESSLVTNQNEQIEDSRTTWNGANRRSVITSITGTSSSNPNDAVPMQQASPPTHDTNNNPLNQSVVNSFGLEAQNDGTSSSSSNRAGDDENDDKQHLSAQDPDDAQESGSTVSDTQSLDSTAATIDSTSEASMAVFSSSRSPASLIDSILLIEPPPPPPLNSSPSSSVVIRIVPQNSGQSQNERSQPQPTPPVQPQPQTSPQLQQTSSSNTNGTDSSPFYSQRGTFCRDCLTRLNRRVIRCFTV